MPETQVMTNREFNKLVKKFQAAHKRVKEFDTACQIASRLVRECPVGCLVPRDIRNFERRNRIA